MAAAWVNTATLNSLILLLCSGADGACQYTRLLNVFTPNLEALSGSCLWIPCTFTIHPKLRSQFDPTKPVQAIWSKTQPFINRRGDDIYVFYNSDRPSNPVSPMTMIGDLPGKNCTTLFSNIKLVHSDDYYLRIENHPFKATALCDPLHINVQDSPWSPSVQVSGRQEEKESVTITCSAPTPCPDSPPKLSWSLHQDPPHTMVNNTDGTFTTSIQQEMTLSDRHDGLQVNCSAVYPVSGGEKRADGNFTLYSPKDTSVQLSGNTPLSVGESVNLSCSSRARPSVQNISWFRVTSEGPQRVHQGHVYSLTVNHSTRGQYFCQAKNQVGEQNSPVITLGHEDSPWSPSVQVSGRQEEKESVTITCSAPTPCPDSPPKLSWSLHQDPPHTMVTNTDGTFTTSIQQEMTLSDRHDGLQVTCSAVYPVSGGEKRADGNFTMRVEYSPKDTSVQLSGNTPLSVGESVNLSCSSRARSPVHISWFRVTSEGPQRVHQGHVYSLTFNCSTRGQYFCQAKNQVGEQNSPVITLGHEDSPWSPSVQVSGRQEEKESVTITCSAPTPCPDSPPKLSWSLHQDPPHTMVTNTDGTFTTSIQQEMTLSDRHDGLQVNCSAVYPVSGGEKRADGNFTMWVEYSPKDTSVQLSGSTPLSVGESVNLSCSSRARSPVHISWFRVTSEGPQRVHQGHVYSLTFNLSTQGQYFCQAKNQVGEQNSPVITLGHEDASVGIGPYNIVKICGIIVLFSALLLIECLVREKATTTRQHQRAVSEDADYVNRVVECQV